MKGELNVSHVLWLIVALILVALMVFMGPKLISAGGETANKLLGPVMA